MRLARTWFALAVIATVAPIAAAQDVRFAAPQIYDDPGTRYIIRPAEDVISLDGLDSQGRLREVTTVRSAEASDSVTSGSVRGGIGNAAVAGPGKAGAANVGFTYLMPFYKFNDFQRAVPPEYASLFPVFGGYQRADSSFAFSPRIDLNYKIEELDLGVSTSGTFLNLTGRVDRQGSQPGIPGTGQFNAQSSLTIVAAVPVEFGRTYTVEGGAGLVAGSQLDVRLGSRYLSVDQHYTGVTTNGSSANSSRYSSQTYRGLGITAAFDWLGDPEATWSPILTARQSLLLGENRQNAAISVTAPNVSVTDNRFDNRTLLVPVTELEAGVRWIWEGATRTRRITAAPRVVVRAAAVGNYYYGMGPLSAGQNDHGFRRSDLFLVGGYIQAGLEF